jgi:ribosomal protein L21
MENVDIGDKIKLSEVILNLIFTIYYHQPLTISQLSRILSPDEKQVLMIGSRKATLVGRPLIDGAEVVVDVEEITKDKKVIAFKMRRRKNSKRTKGFRREVTVLRVTDIVPGEKVDKEELRSIL